MTVNPHRTFPFMYVREWTQIRPVHKLPRDFLWKQQTEEIANYLGRSARLANHILDCFGAWIPDYDSGFYGPACVIWWAIHPGQRMTETSWFNKYMDKLQTLADLGDALLLDE